MFVPKKRDFLLVLILFLSLILGCNGGDGGSNHTPSDVGPEPSTDTLTVRTFEYTPSYKTVLLEPSDFKHLQMTTSGSRIIVLPTSRLYNTIEKWDILMAGISDHFPLGLFGCVYSIVVSQDSMELSLEGPPLENAFKFLKMDLDKTVTLSDTIQKQVYQGVDIQDRDGKFYLTLDAVIYDHDKDPDTLGDQVRVKGTIEFELVFQLYVDINLWTIQSVSFKPVLKETARLTFLSDLAHEVDETMVLAELQTKPFSLGPLVLAPEFKLLLDTKGKLSTQAQAGMDWTHIYEQELSYDGANLVNHWNDSEEPDISFHTSNFKAAVDFKTEFTSEFDFRIFGISIIPSKNKKLFNFLGTIKTDSDRICMEQVSGVETSSQVTLNFFCGHNLDAEDLAFSHTSEIKTSDETCSYLMEYHPVARAGKDRSLLEGSEVILDGSESYDLTNPYDLDDDILSYEWKQTNRNNESGPIVELTNITPAVASFNAPVVNAKGQVLTFDLEVTDYSGNVDRDTVNITIKDKDGLPEIKGSLSGKAVDYATGEPLSDVSVEVFEKRTEMPVEESIGFTTTDSKGKFLIDTLSPNCRVAFSKNGHIPVSLDGITIRSETDTELGKIIMLDDSHSGRGEISISLIDAISGEEIPQANISLKQYTDGKNIDTATTDSEGRCTFKKRWADAYFATAKGNGYKTTTFRVAAYEDVPELTKEIEPVLGSPDEMRIVLTWGPSTLDLDSHLVAPTMSGKRFHLFYPYMHTPNPQYAYLELTRDDIPPNGIETIIIKNRFEGTYTYRVHDHTNEQSKNATDLSASGAVVRVFKGFQEVAAFDVPTDQDGNLWEVVTIDGKTGDITPVNTMAHHTVADLIQMAGSYNTSYNVPAK